MICLEMKLKELSSLELRNEEKKEELEKSILALKTSISKYDSDYNHNMDLLSSISEMLMNLLRNVRIKLFNFIVLIKKSFICWLAGCGRSAIGSAVVIHRYHRQKH